MVATRQSELERVLTSLAGELPDPLWVALVDDQGLVLACVPDQPVVDEDRVSAMTAAVVTTSERVLREVEGGSLRFANIAGSERQYLMVLLTQDRLLSVGLDPKVTAQATFRSLSRWVPQLLRILR